MARIWKKSAIGNGRLPRANSLTNILRFVMIGVAMESDTIESYAEGLPMQLRRLKPDSLNLSVNTVVGSGK